MSDWVQRIRDEGKKLEHRLEVAIAEAEQHLSAAEGVDTVDLDAAENRDDSVVEDDGERTVEEAETTPPETAETTPPEARTPAPEARTPAPEARTTPPEGSGSTTTPNA